MRAWRTRSWLRAPGTSSGSNCSEPRRATTASTLAAEAGSARGGARRCRLTRNRRAAAAGSSTAGLVVILGAEMGDELFVAEVAQRVLELHELDEEIVLRIQTRRRHRALPVEGEPLLDAVHPGARREVHEQRQIQHDRRREDRI